MSFSPSSLRALARRAVLFVGLAAGCGSSNAPPATSTTTTSGVGVPPNSTSVVTADTKPTTTSTVAGSAASSVATTAGASGPVASGSAGNIAAGAGGVAAAGGRAADAGITAGASASGSAGAAAVGGTGGAGSGGAGSAGAARVPMFKKTDCIDPSMVKAGTEIDFMCNGIEFWVSLPSQCQTQTCGLIFNIHGATMTDHATMEQATNMIAWGNAANYIVVHPHSPSGTWNVANDKDKLFAVMQQLIQAFDVDTKRVHSTGYSQGGQLSWALGCDHADVIASIAPAEEINRVTTCWTMGKLPARELPILYEYGKQDSIGGGYAAAQNQVSEIVMADDMMGPETLAGSDSAKYWRQRWTSKTGNVLEFIAHNYTGTGVGGIIAGHCLPLSTGTTFINCSPPVDYEWGKEAVAFFQAHEMP